MFFLRKNDLLAFQTKAGYYDEYMEAPLLNQLIDSNLYLLFRFSLDDNTEAVVTATLLALRNLLLNHPDEVQYVVVKMLERKAHASGSVKLCVPTFQSPPSFSLCEFCNGF
jgi:hypothetical protein